MCVRASIFICCAIVPFSSEKSAETFMISHTENICFGCGTKKRLCFHAIGAEMRGGTRVFKCKGCREVARLVEVDELRQMMESMKRIFTGLGLEEKGEETGDRLAELGQTCQVSRITRESHGFWQFLKAHGRETQCSRIFVNLTECCDQGIKKICTRTIL